MQKDVYLGEREYYWLPEHRQELLECVEHLAEEKRKNWKYSAIQVSIAKGHILQEEKKEMKKK